MRNYTITTINSNFNVQEVIRIERSMGMMEFYVNYGDGMLPVLIIPEQEIISVEAPQQPARFHSSGTFNGAVIGSGTSIRQAANPTINAPITNFGAGVAEQPF